MTIPNNSLWTSIHFLQLILLRAVGGGPGPGPGAGPGAGPGPGPGPGAYLSIFRHLQRQASPWKSPQLIAGDKVGIYFCKRMINVKNIDFVRLHPRPTICVYWCERSLLCSSTVHVLGPGVLQHGTVAHAHARIHNMNITVTERQKALNRAAQSTDHATLHNP